MPLFSPKMALGKKKLTKSLNILLDFDEVDVYTM